MACSDYDQLIDAAKQEQFRDAIFCTFQNEMGGLAFGLLVMGSVGMYTYVKTDSLVTVYALVMVLGGAILPQVASVGLAISVLVMVGVPGAAIVLLLRRAREV